MLLDVLFILEEDDNDDELGDDVLLDVLFVLEDEDNDDDVLDLLFVLGVDEEEVLLLLIESPLLVDDLVSDVLEVDEEDALLLLMESPLLERLLSLPSRSSDW